MGTNLWRRNRIAALCLGVWVAVLSGPGSLNAEGRTGRLVELLSGAENYRVRVQAATALGKLKAGGAVPALVQAIKDKHPLVVISAAVALGQIGDFSVIDDLEKARGQVPSAAARSQIEATLRILWTLSKHHTAKAHAPASGQS